ncbi:hypothetical protein PYCC9005_004378 [Savitreella phatthalungensis]
MEEYPAPSYSLPLAALIHRPELLRQHTSPAPPRSPERHHRRALSAPRSVKETLGARVHKRDDGTRMLNQYLLKQEVGRGSYGTVMLAEDTTDGKEYAIKEFSKARLRKRNHSAIMRRPRAQLAGPAGVAGDSSAIGAGPGRSRLGGRAYLLRNRSATDINKDEEGENPLYLIRTEMAIMKKLDHENLIDLIEVLDDPEGQSLYMVLELCKKGVVMDIGFNSDSKPLDDETARHFFRDLILGVEYLHAQGIAHRDIKPDNLLLSSDDVLKIVDFGVSEMFETQEGKDVPQSGSPAFMSPELCHGMRNTAFLKASDIWSMGVTLFCWKFGTLPFPETNLIQLCNDIMNKPPALLDPSNAVNRRAACDDNLLDLFSRVLEKDPNKRITMDDLREHPWVTCDGEDELLSAEENTAQMIQEITEEDLRTAIKGIKGAVTVVKAVHKLKAMRAARSRSGSPDAYTAPHDAAKSAHADDEYLREVTGDARRLSASSNGHELPHPTVRLAPPTQGEDSHSSATGDGNIAIGKAVVQSVRDRHGLEDERGRRLSADVPEPTIVKRSSSMDAAVERANTSERRILDHAKAASEAHAHLPHPQRHHHQHHQHHHHYPDHLYYGQHQQVSQVSGLDSTRDYFFGQQRGGTDEQVATPTTDASMISTVASDDDDDEQKAAQGTSPPTPASGKADGWDMQRDASEQGESGHSIAQDQENLLISSSLSTVRSFSVRRLKGDEEGEKEEEEEEEEEEGDGR